MNDLIVVDQPPDWLRDIPDIAVVPGQQYLTNPHYGEAPPHTVFNLCKSYRYQSLGYYVSLLAEARGHTPMPPAHILGDLRSHSLVRLLTDGMDELIQDALGGLQTEVFELPIYFGRSPNPRFDPLARQLFAAMRAPLLCAHFFRHRNQWHIHALHPVAAGDVPAELRALATEAARDYFRRRQGQARRRGETRRSLAILHDPHHPEPPSNAQAMQNFLAAADAAGLRAELITRADSARLPEFDALFVRDTTYVNHYTYRFARRAAAEGLVVIDDPDSIVRCNNKVYLAELFAQHHIPAPKTLVVHRGNTDHIAPTLGLPCVLKQPDSSGSVGVIKVENEMELAAKVDKLLERSALIVAQEYLPTDFDWRIGVIDGRALFACKYYMAQGHWQIIKRDQQRKLYEGPVQAVPVSEAPDEVVRLALQVAGLIGDSLYGVDIKQVDGRCCVIEVNDNPNVDAGNEDAVLQQALYRDIMGVFARRIEERYRCEPR